MSWELKTLLNDFIVIKAIFFFIQISSYVFYSICFFLDGSDTDASQLLGEVDTAFLFCYAIAMFGSGFIAERVNLRYFLSLGMLLSGLFTYVVGLAKVYNIHNLWYFILMQVSIYADYFIEKYLKQLLIANSFWCFDYFSDTYSKNDLKQNFKNMQKCYKTFL